MASWQSAASLQLLPAITAAPTPAAASLDNGLNWSLQFIRCRLLHCLPACFNAYKNASSSCCNTYLSLFFFLFSLLFLFFFFCSVLCLALLCSLVRIAFWGQLECFFLLLLPSCTVERNIRLTFVAVVRYFSTFYTNCWGYFHFVTKCVTRTKRYPNRANRRADYSRARILIGVSRTGKLYHMNTFRFLDQTWHLSLSQCSLRYRTTITFSSMVHGIGCNMSLCMENLSVFQDDVKKLHANCWQEHLTFG